MLGENTQRTLDESQTESVVPNSTPEAISKRQRSSIAFPYVDLNEGITVARTAHSHVGTGTCTPDQLAAWINQSPTSSTFRLRLTASRLFGLIETDRGESIRLTELGLMVLDQQRDREGRAQAFLQVPLYRAVYEKHRGGIIPPPAALEKEFVVLGVAETLTDRARPVMERSAEQAGYHNSGKDRLVKPGYSPSLSPNSGSEKPPTNGGGGGGGGNQGGEPPRHPLIEGLFQSLPEDGELWTIEEAADWLQAAAYNLRFAYKLKGGSLKVEFVPQKIDG